jgi:hypothetical protein
MSRNDSDQFQLDKAYEIRGDNTISDEHVSGNLDNGYAVMSVVNGMSLDEVIRTIGAEGR